MGRRAGVVAGDAGADWISGRGPSRVRLDAGQGCAGVPVAVLSEVEPRICFIRCSKFFRVDPKIAARHLSRGERAGLCLAMVLAPEPDLLVLDDPAIGLDPVARRSLLESMVYATRKSDRTIIFSSHLLADIERMADHIAVLDYSVLRAQCSLDTFRSCVQQFCPGVSWAGRRTLPAIRGMIQCVARGKQLRLTLVNVTQETLAVLRGLGPVELREAPISLEDAFVSYLGGSLENVRLGESRNDVEISGGVR